MVYGLLPTKTKLMRFGLEASDLCFFCNEKDDKDHFLSCSQASGMGEATRILLSELIPDKKEVSWQQMGSLELHLAPVQRLPALILVSELGLEIYSSRAKKKKLSTVTLTSKLRFRAEVVSNSRKHQDASFELTDWIENQLCIPDTERISAPVVVNSVAAVTSHGYM